MKKRLLSLLLVAVMIISLLPMAEVKAASLPNGAKWLVNEEDTYVWYKLEGNSEGGETLTIGGTGAMPDYDIDSNMAPWHEREEYEDGEYDYINESIRKVIIEDGVTSIGDYAFFDCISLKEIVISESVTGIGNSAFKFVEELEEIKIPSNVGSIGEEAFRGCSNLKRIEIPQSVTSISDGMFSGCSGLTEITIPSGVEYIAMYAFEECTGLTEITIPSGVEHIAMYAFKECSGLTEITIKSDETVIEEEAFFGCTGLKKIRIPESMRDTIIQVLEYCEISDVDIVSCDDDEDDDEDDDDDFWLIDEGDNHVWYKLKGNPSDGKTLTIGGTGAMPDYDFDNENMAPWHEREEYEDGGYDYINNSIIKVIIEDGVTSIGNYAFYDCFCLKEIEISESVTGIGNSVFAYVEGLEEIEIPSKVVSIGEEAFKRCTNLTKLVVKANTAPQLGESAFEDTYCLKKIYVSSGSQESYKSAEGWKDLNISGSSTVYLEYNADSGAISVEESSIPIKFDPEANETVTVKVEPEEGYALKRLEYSDGIEIHEITEDEEGLYKFIMPVGDVTVTATFYNLNYLKPADTEWLIYEGDTYVWYKLERNPKDGEILTIGGTGAMPDYDIDSNMAPWHEWEEYDYINESISKVIIEDGVTSIGNYAFYDCISLKEIEISESVTGIGNSAFAYVEGLEEIEIPSKVVSIGEEAFIGCSNLKRIEIPSNVGSIGSGAFRGCSNLKRIEIPQSVTRISDGMFSGCSGLTEITLLSGVEYIDIYAFEGCTGLTEITIPSGVEYIAMCAFKGCTGLTEITLPPNGTGIDNEAFVGCTGLKMIRIPESMRDTITQVLEYCELSDVNIVTYGDDFWLIYEGKNHVWYRLERNQEGGETLTIGGTGAMPDYGSDETDKAPWLEWNESGNYTYNNRIKNVVIEEGVTSIGDYAFCGCSGLTEILIPESMRSNIDGAFDGCEISKISFSYWIVDEGNNQVWYKLSDDGETLTIGGTGAMPDYGSDETDKAPWLEWNESGNYTYNNRIKNVVIEEGVTSIGDYAFYGCAGLTDITILESVTSIGINAFEGCNISNTYNKEGDNVITARLGNGDCMLPGIFAKLTLPVPSDFVYDGTAKEIIFNTGEAENWKKTTHTDVPAIIYYMEGGNTGTYAGTENEGKAPVNAGKYVAKITVENETATVNFTVVKSTPAAPKGLLAVQPTEYGKQDGKITETSDAMEYSTNTESEIWTPCSGTEITGLEAGKYYVRLKETVNTNTGECAELIVPDGNKRLTLTVKGYEGVYDGNAHGIILSGADLDGATVMYGNSEGNYDKEENIKFTDVTEGSVTVYFKVSKDKYHDFCGSETVKITKKDIADAEVGSFASMTYTGSEQTPSATVTVDGLTVTGSWSKVTDVADTATFTADGNFEGTIANLATGMEKSTPASPEGIGSVQPTEFGAADGKITGTTAAMEYSTSADFVTEYDCTATETAGLAAGTYYVRLKKTSNTNAGAYATVTISEGDKKNFEITVINYNADYDGKAHGITLTGVPEGATVKYGTAEGTYNQDSITYTECTDGAKKVYVQVTMYGYNDFTGDGSINITKSKPVDPKITPDPVVPLDPIVTPDPVVPLDPIVTPDPEQENVPTVAPGNEGQTGETTEGQSGEITEGQSGETTPAEGDKTKDDKPAVTDEEIAARSEIEQQLAEAFTENKIAVTEQNIDSAVSVTKKDSAYYDENGKKITSSFIVTSDGNIRYVGNTGKSVKKAIVATYDAETGEMKMYYAGKNGVIVKDKVVTLPDGGKIFASEDGTLATNEIVTSGKHQYFAGKDGKLATNQIIKLEDGTRYFANRYGFIRKNAIITAPDGDKRYATADGTLAKSCWVTVGKKMYRCNKIGRITESKPVK